MKKVISIFVIIVSIYITSCSRKKDFSSLNIVQITSLKGIVFPKDKKGIKYGGFSLLSQKIKDIRKNTIDNNLILVGNSNFIYGSLETYFTKGQAVIDFMNKVKFDLLVIGHRELYFGKDVLTTLSENANFPLVSANLVEADGSVPSFIKPYHIIKKSNIAIIGVSTHMLTETNIPEDLKGLKLNPIKTSIEKYVKELRQMGVKKIVVVGDLIYNEKDKKGRTNEFKIALNISDVDYFMVRYDKLTGKEGVLKIKNEKRQDKKVLVCGSKGKTLCYYSFDGKTSREKYQIFKINSKEIKPDPKMIEPMAQLQKTIESIAGKVIGEAKADISHSYREESELGNFITDVVRKYTNTDIYLYNSGSAREGLKKGKISKMDMYKILPWGGTPIITEMTGNQLLKILESSCAFKMGKSFLQVSGIKFKFDLSKKPFKRVITNSIEVNGKKLAMNKTYRVGTGRYIFEGGDNYNEFADQGLKILKIHPESMRDIMIDYTEKVGKVESKIEGRIIDISKK